MAEELPILYRDEFIVVIDKPPNLLVHRSQIDRHETRFAVQLLRDQLGRHVSPAHRLDRGTSGVLVFALDKDTARALGGQFERQEVVKTYLAVVRGHPPEAGHIDHALSRRRDDVEWVGERSADDAQRPRFRRRTCLESVRRPSLAVGARFESRRIRLSFAACRRGAGRLSASDRIRTASGRVASGRRFSASAL